MTIAFDDPVASVLAFVNYSPYDGVGSLSVYDAMDRLIESIVLDFTTSGGDDTGQWLGFSESSNVIKSIRFGDAYIVAANLQTAAAAVPSPGTLPLIGLGIASLVFTATRRRKNERVAMPRESRHQPVESMIRR